MISRLYLGSVKVSEEFSLRDFLTRIHNKSEIMGLFSLYLKNRVILKISKTDKGVK